MGGIGSGRRRTANRGYLENAVVLDLRVLRQRGALRPYYITTGAMEATGATRKPFCWTCSLDLSDPAYGVLCVTVGHSGQPKTHRIHLIGVECRFGGWRYFAICPVTRARVLRLVYVDGRFMSPKAARLTYRTQGMDRLTRLNYARSKAEAQAFGRRGCPRPRGRNRERLEARYEVAEARFEREWVAGAERMLEKSPTTVWSRNFDRE